MFVNIIQEKPPIIKGNIHQKKSGGLVQNSKREPPVWGMPPKVK